jgi:hypothetical protein
MSINKEEKEASRELWKAYANWRSSRTSYPKAEGKQLPIEPGGSIEGNLSLHIDQFVRKVVSTLAKGCLEKDVLYAQICIWDPFRQTSDVRWATSKKRITKSKNINKKLNNYEEKASKSEKSIFRIQYEVGERETICIKIPQRASSEGCELMTDISLISGGKKEIERDIEQVVGWHSVFEGDNERFFYYIPSTFNPSGAGIGGLMLLVERKISEWFTIQIREIVESFLSKIGVGYQNRIVLDRSRKSAIAGIMARNMSHNLGSHVIWHISRDIKGSGLKDMKETDLSELGMYIQKRMDFIAQVATSEPAWGVSMTWKELTKAIKQNNALWDNIARSEDIREEQIELSVDSEYNPLVSIPHGRVGAQAFYTIIENILRNASKHSDPTFLDQVKDNEDNTKLKLELKMTSIQSTSNNEYYKRVLIKDNSPVEKNVEDIINNKLNEDMINSRGRINEEAWGLKEIKVCSGYLRGVNPNQVDKKHSSLRENGDKPSLVNVRAITDPGKSGLQYEIFFKKPMIALLLGFDVQNSTNYRKKGVEFVDSASSLKSRLESGPVNHEFLVVESNFFKNNVSLIEDKLSILPVRILICGGQSEFLRHNFSYFETRASFCDDFKVPSHENIRDYLWDQWVSDQWWNESIILARWNLSNATICDDEYSISEEYRVPKLEKQSEQAPDSVFSTLVSNEESIIVFDHEEDADDTLLYDEALYHTTFKGGSTTADLLINSRKSLIKEYTCISVAIIDERIWMKRDIDARYGISKYNDPISCKLANVWEKRRVKIMNTDLAFKDFKKFVDGIESIYDFLVVHQGIIEDAKSKLDDFRSVWNELKSQCRWIVVDTGRGKPDRAREEGLRWVEYSNLSECIVESSGDKKKLVDLLTSLRAEV